MTVSHKKILSEYKEIKEMFNTSAKSQLRISEQNYGRLSQTLRILVGNDYLININADDAHFYMKNSSFDYFEDDFRAEINEPLPKLFSLFEEIDLILEEFRSLDLFEPTLHDVPRFIVWKTKVEYELQKLNPAEIVNQCLGQLNCFNGLNDEELFNKVAANLAVIVENYEDFISPLQSKQSQKEEDCSKANKIFISHASDDKKYMELLVRLLEFMGLNEENLICTSVTGYGVPLNAPIYDFLRSSFNDYNLHVVFAHSHNFYTRSVCLNEMGAAWVAKTKHTSILLPNFNYAEMTGVVDSTNLSIKLDGDRIEVRHRLNELYDIIVADFNLIKKSSRWEEIRDEFIEQINAMASSPCENNSNAVIEEPVVDPNVVKLLETAHNSSTQADVIMRIKDFGGTTIQAGNIEVNVHGDNRDTAKWEHVLRLAIDGGFIIQTDSNGNRFELTVNGFELLDEL